MSRDELPLLLPDFDPDAVAEIRLRSVDVEDGTSQGREEIVIARDAEGAWSLASEHDFPVEPDRVSTFLGDLRGARLKNEVTRREETFDDYVGAEGWLAVEALDAQGETLAQFDLGKSAGWPETFVRVTGDPPRIVRAYDLTRPHGALTVAGWSNPMLWRGLTTAAVTQVDIFQRDESGTLSFVRSEEEAPPAEPGAAPPETGVWDMRAPKEADARTAPVEAVIRTFTGMRFEDVVGQANDTPSLEPYGLLKPAYRAIVYTPSLEEPGTDQSYAIQVGDPVPGPDGEPGDSFYVRRVSDGFVFRVGRNAINPIRASVDDYLEVPTPLVPVPGEGETGIGDPDAAPGEPLPPGPPPIDPDAGRDDDETPPPSDPPSDDTPPDDTPPDDG